MTDIVPVDSASAPVGLEDMGESLTMPRLTIMREEAMFKDSLSNETYESLETVVLGLVQQRVLWEPEVKDNASPLCRSRDGKIGLPQKDFPWAASGFEKIEGDEQQELPCAACPLKEWGSHPTRDVPWCQEQFVVVLYHEGGPALLTVQRSGLSAVRNYGTSFSRAGQPTFTKYTTITLTAQKRGSVRYAVPVFTTTDKTPVEDHDFYADIYMKTRAFLHTAPRKKDNDAEDVAQAAVKSRERREPAVVDETDDPF